MKKNIFLLLIILYILVIFNLFLLAEENDYDFRETNWGMNKEQVKEKEKGKIIDETKNEVVFMVPDFDDNFQCVYSFLENILYQSSYLFIGMHIYKNDYIDDYERRKEVLTKKYGEPKTDNILWKNERYKDDESQWGLAISLGHLVYRAEWETPSTEIKLSLVGSNNKIWLGTIYESKELKEWVKDIQEKEALKGL